MMCVSISLPSDCVLREGYDICTSQRPSCRDSKRAGAAAGTEQVPSGGRTLLV